MQVNIWYCFLFIALALVPKRTSFFDHLADNIRLSFHKSNGVERVERWRVSGLHSRVGLERQKSKNLNKISFSYMSGMHMKMINSLTNCQAAVKLWRGIWALSDRAKTQMTFASRLLEAANQKLLLHKDTVLLAEQRTQQLAASAAIFLFYPEQSTGELFPDKFLLLFFGFLNTQWR